MKNEEQKIKEENMFDLPKLIDATGKELSKQEIIKFMEMKKENLLNQKKYIEEHINDEMFSNIPRQR